MFPPLVFSLGVVLVAYVTFFFSTTIDGANIANPSTSGFDIGVGIYDVTGQVAEVGFMGYAVPSQRGSGLHMRMRSRAFIFVDTASTKRVVYVSVDNGMAFYMVKLAVIERLTVLYGSLYQHDNVIISGTHTHSTPGGVGGTALVDITTFGFCRENYEAAVDGIVASIARAHRSIQPGRIKIARGPLTDANINRSPVAYLRDPPEERAKFDYDTDHDMTVLRLESVTGEELGMINWFAVHGTSMNNTNTLVSGDNKGYASLQFESLKNPTALPGKGQFVAAFGQSNLGDVSPNTKGPHCPDGLPCDFVHSTCAGFTETCIASGPGRDMVESTQIIGQKQVDAAITLYQNASQPLGSGIDYRYTYVDMQTVNIASQFTSTGQPEHTCQAALGYAFAAGTTDGPGDFDFTQSTNSSNPFWAFVSSFLAAPTAEQIACQAPKPILLDVGLIKPIEWVPFILPHQLVRIGNLYIAAVPGEFTTMSGRRLRTTITQALEKAGVWSNDSLVVIAGLSNSYSHYITTYEEYQQQRYEGASTLYGPHTLSAYQQSYFHLSSALANGVTVPLGVPPMDMRNHTFNFLPGVIEDNTPVGVAFGQIQLDVQPKYQIGQTAAATFWGASPRNALFTEKTFLTVEFQDAFDSWNVIATDGNWETRFIWKRVGIDQSHCTTTWTIPSNTAPGTYRFQHFGVSKNVFGTMTPYSGMSSSFVVAAESFVNL